MENIELENYTLYDALKYTADNSRITHNGIYYIDGDGEERFQPYYALYENAVYILGQLLGNNLKKGDKLIFQFKNEFPFINTFWACVIGGIVPVPVKCAHSNKTTISDFSKLMGITEQLEHTLIITEEEIIDSLLPVQQEIKEVKVFIFEGLMEQNYALPDGFPYTKASDLAYIQYSSGSTGDPKGVQLTHSNLLHNMKDIIARSGIFSDDFIGNWMPLTHDMGLIGMSLMPTCAAISHFQISTDVFIRKPFLFLQKVTSHKVSLLGAPNFAISWLHDKISDQQIEELDLSPLRVIYNGAEPISVDVAKKFLSRFEKCGLRYTSMFTVYGMAEASLAVSFPRINEFTTVKVDRDLFTGEGKIKEYVEGECVGYMELADEGYPMPTMQIRIINKEGQVLEDNHIGEIVIKGPNVTSGYYNNPEANRNLFIDGFLRTGDLGFIKNSRLIVTGRKKDIIFVNGQNYYPHDLEFLASEIEGIEHRNIVFVGASDHINGIEKILGFYVYRKKLKDFIGIADKIRTHLYNRLGIYVHHILPVHSIPKTTSGKMQRYKFKQSYEKGEYAEIIDQLTEIENKIYDLSDVNIMALKNLKE